MPDRSSPQDALELAHSQLFTLRVWREDLGQGQFEWRGKVQHMTSGEAHYFRDWSGLIACLQQILGNQLEHTE